MIVRQTDGQPSEGLADDCQTTDHDGLQVWTWKAFGEDMRHGSVREAWAVREEHGA